MEPSSHPGRSVLGSHSWSCCSPLPYFLVLRVPLGAGKFFLMGACAFFTCCVPGLALLTCGQATNKAAELAETSVCMYLQANMKPEATGKLGKLHQTV